MCGPKPPSAPQLPQYPGLTPEEQNILTKQGMSLDQFNQIIQAGGAGLQQNQDLLKGMSGLYNPDGSINQTSLANLQQRTQQAIQTQGQSGQSALNYLQNLYGAGGALPATQTAYTNALAGNVPANQQLEYSQGENFNAMKENAAQRGINITGDSWKNAVSDSTAGQKLIQNYQQNSNIQNQNYQLGYVNQLAGNMGQLSGVGAQTGASGMSLAQGAANQPIGYAGQAMSQGPLSLTPYLSQYQQGLNQFYQPYYMQQVGPYQQQMAQQQANYQAGMNSSNFFNNQNMGWANFGLNVLGTGASAASKFGGPSGAAQAALPYGQV